MFSKNKKKTPKLLFGSVTYKKLKFNKTLGEKTFYSEVKFDEFYFIEDIVFNVVSKYKPNLLEKQFCLVTLLNKEKYVITFFNDTTNDKPNGESSIEYLLSDFSEEEIKEFIKSILIDQGYTNDDLVLLTIDEDFLMFSNIFDESGESLLVNEDMLENIGAELMTTTYKKHHSKINSIIFVFIIFIVTIFAYIKLSDYYLNELNKKTGHYSKLEKDIDKIKKDIKDQEIKQRLSQDKMNLIDVKNIKVLDEKIYSLELPGTLKDESSLKEWWSFNYTFL